MADSVNFSVTQSNTKPTLRSPFSKILCPSHKPRVLGITWTQPTAAEELERHPSVCPFLKQCFSDGSTEFAVSLVHLLMHCNCAMFVFMPCSRTSLLTPVSDPNYFKIEILRMFLLLLLLLWF